MQILNDFVRGEEDCKAGRPHLEGQSREYDEGYGFQHQKEQIETARSIESDRQHQQQA
jgi:hypothetical protein